MSTVITHQKIMVLRAVNGIDAQFYASTAEMIEAEMYRFCSQANGDTSHLKAAVERVIAEVDKDWKPA